MRGSRRVDRESPPEPPSSCGRKAPKSRIDGSHKGADFPENPRTRASSRNLDRARHQPATRARLQPHCHKSGTRSAGLREYVSTGSSVTPYQRRNLGGILHRPSKVDYSAQPRSGRGKPIRASAALFLLRGPDCAAAFTSFRVFASPTPLVRLPRIYSV
jgi:hypothetical protein